MSTLLASLMAMLASTGGGATPGPGTGTGSGTGAGTSPSAILRAHNSAAWTFTSTTIWAPLSFDTVDQDSGWGFVAPSSNLVIPTGITRVLLSFRSQSPTTTSAYNINTRVTKNGVNAGQRYVVGSFQLNANTRVALPVVAGNTLQVQILPSNTSAQLDGVNSSLSIFGW